MRACVSDILRRARVGFEGKERLLLYFFGSASEGSEDAATNELCEGKRPNKPKYNEKKPAKHQTQGAQNNTNARHACSQADNSETEGRMSQPRTRE